MKKSHRLSGIILIALVLTVATFAFAAANTMPATTSAGDGATTISGYTISNVDYVLNVADPSQIATVTFNIVPTDADSVQIQLITGGSWYSCTNTAGSVSCTITGGVAALAADNLRVVAAD